MLFIVWLQINFIDINSEHESIDEMHHQPHHMMCSAVVYPLEMYNILDNLRIKDIQLVSFLAYLHQRNRLANENLFWDIAMRPMFVGIFDVKTGLNQKVDSVFYLFD